VKRRHRPSPQTLAVLLALAAKPERWSHGYDLCRSLDLKPGTVYPILIRLAERGAAAGPGIAGAAADGAIEGVVL
jgi:PadR family transcriptional regulator, regulatory protein PadR